MLLIGIVKSENENLRMHFRMLCQMTGISLDWDKSEGEDVIIDLGSVSGDFAAIGGSRTTGRIPIARMTGRIVLDDIPGLGGEIREIKIDRSIGFPFVSETVPPASSMMSAPAAISHGLRPNSQYPSKRPQAM